MGYTSVKAGFQRHEVKPGVVEVYVKVQSRLRPSLWSYFSIPCNDLTEAEMRKAIEGAAEMLCQKQHDEIGDNHDSGEVRRAAMEALDSAINQLNARAAVQHVAADKPVAFKGGAPTKLAKPH